MQILLCIAYINFRRSLESFNLGVFQLPMLFKTFVYLYWVFREALSNIRCNLSFENICIVFYGIKSFFKEWKGRCISKANRAGSLNTQL